MTDQEDKAQRDAQRESNVSAVAGFLTGAMNDSRFDQALETAKEFNLPEDGIKFARGFAGAQLAFAAILMGGFKDGWSGASNAAFSSAVGAMWGPAAGAAYGWLLDKISAETRKRQVGESMYDILHSKEISEFIYRNREVLAQGAGAIMRSVEGAPDAPRPITDASGKLQGYFVITRDPKTQSVTATTLMPDGNVARQRVFDGDTLTTSGNGITVMKDFRTGETTATTPWDSDPVPVQADGAINANGCQIKLSQYPLGGATVTCGNETFNAAPSADFTRQGDLVVVRNGGKGTMPSLAIGSDGNSYALGYNWKTGQLYTTPFGDSSVTSTSDVLSWLRQKGGQTLLKELPGTGTGPANPSGATGESWGSAGAHAGRIANDRFNSDGSGSSTTTNPDGTNTTTNFGRLNGAVKLADIFGTLPEVVAAHPELFALRYMAMANVQAVLSKNLSSGASDVDTPSSSSSDAQQAAGADASDMTGQEAAGTSVDSSDQGDAQERENQESANGLGDEASVQEAMA